MNHYETVYIVHPAIQEGRLNDIISKFHNKLSKLKGEVLYIENWGKKKLAYAIDKQKYGTYIMCQYSLDGQNVKEISQELELNPNILRYLISKVESSDIKEGSNTLEIESKNDDSKAQESKNDDSKESSVKDDNTEEPSKEKNDEENSSLEDVVDENNNESISDDEVEKDA
jgi:small subunit ribosomal protein S6